jgi:NAD+ synthase
MTMQQQIRTALAVEPTIDPAAEIERRVRFLADYLVNTGARGYVLGISGGQDSTLAGRLCQLAVERVREMTSHYGDGEPVNEPVFVAVGLPYKVQADADDAAAAMAFIKPDKSYTVNIEPAVTGLEKSLTSVFPGGLTDYNRGNVKARVRMIEQYAIAGELGLLVVGTDHAAEAVTGFYTKFGDGACDITPLAGLTKGQGREMLRTLKAPARLWEKAPTADLLDGKPGQTDEAELGVSYDSIDKYLMGEHIPLDDANSIESRYANSEHKRQLPVTPTDTWWKKNR